MATVVTKTIGTGGDYSTVQAWEDAAPANLVTADQVWRGECFNQTFTGTVTVSGSTTDATRYKHLTVASGAGFASSAGPLRYDTSAGAAVVSNTDYSNGHDFSEANFLVEGLQFSTSGYSSVVLALGSGVTLKECIIKAGSNDKALHNSGGGALTNCLIQGYTLGFNELTATNCTFITPTDTVLAYAISINYGTRSFTNCAVFGFTAVHRYAYTNTNCYSDVASTGSTVVAYDTTTGSGFTNISSHATLDARLKSTSSLIDNGTSTGAPSTDIYGQARPSGTGYDVGAWEYTAAGGGATTLTSPLLSTTQNFYSSAISQTTPSTALVAACISNLQTFYAPTVGRGAVTLNQSLLINAQTFYPATVVSGGTISPPIVVNTQVYYSPTVVRSAVSLTASRLTNSQTFFTAVVVQSTLGQTLAAPLLENVQAFYNSSLGLSARHELTPQLLINTQSFYGSTIGGGNMFFRAPSGDGFSGASRIRAPRVSGGRSVHY